MTTAAEYKSYDYRIKCNRTSTDDVKLSSSGNTANASYTWLDSTHIQDTKGKPTFTVKTGTNQFYDNADTDEPACKDYISVGGDVSKGDYYKDGKKLLNGSCEYNGSNDGSPTR